jgi:hypothetical protein
VYGQDGRDGQYGRDIGMTAKTGNGGEIVFLLSDFTLPAFAFMRNLNSVYLAENST